MPDDNEQIPGGRIPQHLAPVARRPDPFESARLDSKLWYGRRAAWYSFRVAGASPPQRPRTCRTRILPSPGCGAFYRYLRRLAFAGMDALARVGRISRLVSSANPTLHLVFVPADGSSPQLDLVRELTFADQGIEPGLAQPGMAQHLVASDNLPRRWIRRDATDIEHRPMLRMISCR